MVDEAENPNGEDAEVLRLAARSGKPWIYIGSKRDLSGVVAGSAGVIGKAGGGPAATVFLSAKTGEGMDALAAAVAAIFPAGDAPAGEILTNARQADAVSRALDSLRAARRAMEAGVMPDAVLTETEAAMSALGELTGRTVREDVTARIFERFCVGK